jgi:hypothetical protein
MATRKTTTTAATKAKVTKAKVTKAKVATKTVTPRAKKVAEPKVKAAPKLKIKGKSPKEIATEKGEPYVNILSVELDPDNVGNGAFELDWNDKFIAQLVRAGYQAQANEPENIIVDRWFQTVCRNILAENFEQWEAGQPQGRANTREDLGGGKTGVS